MIIFKKSYKKYNHWKTFCAISYLQQKIPFINGNIKNSYSIVHSTHKEAEAINNLK